MSKTVAFLSILTVLVAGCVGQVDSYNQSDTNSSFPINITGYPYSTSPIPNKTYWPEFDYSNLTPISDTDKAIRDAKSWAIENGYTDNISELVVSQAYNMSSGNVIKISFEQQPYKGIPIVIGADASGGYLDIFVDSNGVFRANGFLHNDIKAPTEAVISKQDAENRIVGQELVFYNYFGQKITWKIEKEDLRPDPPITKNTSMVIYVKDRRDTNSIEYHTAWAIPVTKTDRAFSFPWTVYIDAINGEELETRQNFST